MNKERHHVPARIIAKIFGLPKSICEVEMVDHNWHRQETKYLNDMLPTLYGIPKKGVIYSSRIIKREDIK
jgi:hypothetical protein